MNDKHNFKVGDIVIITANGGGTSNDDVGLICQIVTVYTRESTPSRYGYMLEIDRDKKGNNDRFLDPAYIRLATAEQVRVFNGEAPIHNNYQIY